MLASLADFDVLFIFSLAFRTVDVTHRVYLAPFICFVKKLIAKNHYDSYLILLYIQQYIENCQRIYTIYSVTTIRKFLQVRDHYMLVGFHIISKNHHRLLKSKLIEGY